ncbi:hypothetical protein TRICI_002281 [Trichomonascus ciferrii]|uniref:L-ornithine N(5)-oxygenase n=1 Tax=Trichomonascus ciferrii TaxID=44093 RepID=A0A642V8F7_9ASCO|nr:hypothetical protein TRICI_002281 [Trichomonascus ciferrii]
MPEPRVLIVGAGVGGIMLGCKMQLQAGFTNYMIYEKNESLGGTWFQNTYPGVGCDVECHFYSFSFNRNPNWSRRFAGQEEILEYVKETADKFGVTEHVRLNTEVLGAKWIAEEEVWRVRLRDVQTGVEFTREAEIFISAVGVFGQPRDCDIPGHDEFEGRIVHTARWDNKLDLTDKRVAVVGNGCSAAQLVPAIAPKVKNLVQFQRTPQYFFERPNREFSSLEKFLFKNIPLWQRIYRYSIYHEADSLHGTYLADTQAHIKQRENQEKHALDYMKRTAPKKYWDILTPDFPVGCKRRIFDPGYLASLHRDNVYLTTDRIARITKDSIITNSGEEYKVDAILLATGYKVQDFLAPMEIIGKNGISLNRHWEETNGAQAYKSCYVNGFPNFGIVFGPNSFPAHNSVIYTNEVSSDYLIKSMIRPITEGNFKVIEVKESAEMADCTLMQNKLRGTVWSETCKSWNVNSMGRNTTSYYDYAYKFWYNLYWPVWKDFELTGVQSKPPQHPIASALQTGLALSAATAATAVATFYYLGM